MRVALVAEAFQARTPFDTESHVRSLAPAMARAGVEVEVFAGTRGSGIPPYCQRRFEVADHVGSVAGRGATFGVTTVEVEGADDEDRIAEAFGIFLDRERPDVCHFEHLHAFGVGLVREARQRGIATIYSAADTWPAHDRTTLTLPDLSPFELGDGEAEARALAAEALLAASGITASGSAVADDKARREKLSTWLHGPMNRAEEVAAMRDAREAVEKRRAQKRVALSAVDRRFASSRLLSKELSAAVGRAFTFRAPGIDSALVTAALATVAQSAASRDAGSRGRGARFVFCGTTRLTGGVDTLLDAFEIVRKECALLQNSGAGTSEAESSGEGGPAANGTAADQPTGPDGPIGSAESPEAARSTEPQVRLMLVLRSTDEPRDAEIAARARALGAEVRFENDAKASIAGPIATAIAESDALVLPALWGEVAPALTRFALASGRPIIASRMPGLIEAVPQSAGTFVAPGDPQALAAALQHFATGSRGESTESAKSMAQAHAITLGADAIRSGGTKSIDDETAEWLDTYQQLISTRASAERSRTLTDRAPLDNLAEVRAQFDELGRLSVAELFTRAQEGLGQLRTAFGVDDSEAELLSRVIGRGGVARDRAELDAVIRTEVARALTDLGIARETMRREEEGRARRVADLQAVLSSFEKEVLARGAVIAQSAQDLESSRALAEELGGKVARLESERSALEDAVQRAESQRDAQSDEILEARTLRERADDVIGQVEKAKAALAEAEDERRRMAESIARRESEIEGLRERVGRTAGSSEHAAALGGKGEMGDLESIAAYCTALERDVDSLRRHDAWMTDKVTGLIARLTRVAPAVAAAGSDGEPADDPLESQIERTADSLGALVDELDWRRCEMEAARSAGASLRARFLSSPLAARVRRWDQGPAAAPGSGIGSGIGRAGGSGGVGGTTDPAASHSPSSDSAAYAEADADSPPAPLPSADGDGEAAEKADAMPVGSDAPGGPSDASASKPAASEQGGN